MMLQGKQLEKRLKEYHQKIFYEDLFSSILPSKKITIPPIHKNSDSPVIPLNSIIENLYPPISIK
jgi:hypothetical protein